MVSPFISHLFLTYDSSGNILTYNGNAYNWNAANQLSFVSTGGSTVGTYTYNYLNQRTKKVAGGTTTFYVYGLNGQLYGEYTSAGALVREYVYLNGNPLAQVNSGSPETATWLHTDQLGTPRFGTNSSGTQVWAWNSDAFGNGTPTGSVTVNLRLPGQYFDSESGLFNNWNRYYNPTLGRYITSDPIGLAGGSNTFNYAQQSPLKYTDPTGKAPAVFPLAELVLWGSGWVTLEVCNTMPDCRQYYADKIDNAIKATKDAANSAIQWCQNKLNDLFNTGSAADDGKDSASGSNKPNNTDDDERCFNQCQHLLYSNDLQKTEYRKCYRECKGTL